MLPPMSEEPTEEELRELGAPPRASKKLIVVAVIAGVLAALALVAASQYAGRRDAAETPRTETPR